MNQIGSPGSEVVQGNTGSPPPGGEHPGESLSFFTPNTEDLNFEQAHSRFHSSNQAAFRKIATEVAQAVGLPNHQTHDAIGDTTRWGSEPAVVQRVGGEVDPNQLEYAAAWYGLLGHQKSMLTFQSHPQGPDSVYQIQVGEPDTKKVRESLDLHGLENRTIIPASGGHTILIVDGGRRLEANVRSFAGANNATVREARGRTSEVGGSSDRVKSRAVYRDIIRRHESGGTVGSRYRPPVRADTARLSRKGVRRGILKAPEGGALVRGVFYRGGQTIPLEGRGVIPETPVRRSRTPAGGEDDGQDDRHWKPRTTSIVNPKLKGRG